MSVSDFYEPQNGGFSLRSKRLLNILRELNLTLEVSAPEFNNTDPITMKWADPRHFEDTYLTTVKRRILEENGIKFAPRELSCYFSLEHSIVQHTLNIPFQKILGVHFCSDAILIEENKVQFRSTLNCTEQEFRQLPLIDTLLNSNHQVYVLPHSA